MPPKQKQKQNRKPTQVRRRRAIVNPMGRSALVQALDARVLAHVPPSVPMGPYTVVRSRNVRTITTDTTGASTVMLIGPHRLVSIESCITPIIAIIGTGANVPGTTEQTITDVGIQGYAGTILNSTANAQLHAITVVVQSTSSATAAQGLVYVGSLAQRVGRQNYATYNALASALINRRELSPFAAYSTMTKPAEHSAYPVDMTEWSMQVPVHNVGATPGDNYHSDTLSQIAVVFPATTVAVDYNVSIFTEWRVNFTDSVLNSTAVRHDPTPTGLWNKIVQNASALNGRISDLALGAEKLTSMGSAIGTTFRAFSGVGARLGQLGALGKFAGI